jgi:cupin 2 domain-containing protein
MLAMRDIVNLFSSIPADLSAEFFQTLFESKSFRIERIISRGHISPPDSWYDQEQNEWVLLAQGMARLRFENESVDMKPGDFIHIPAHSRHRVEWTTPNEPTIWLAIHYD